MAATAGKPAEQRTGQRRAEESQKRGAEKGLGCRGRAGHRAYRDVDTGWGSPGIPASQAEQRGMGPRPQGPWERLLAEPRWEEDKDGEKKSSLAQKCGRQPGGGASSLHIRVSKHDTRT